MDIEGPLLSVPYGSARQECRLKPGRKVTVLKPLGPSGEAGAAPDEAAIIAAALLNPIGSPALSELARGPSMSMEDFIA